MSDISAISTIAVEEQPTCLPPPLPANPMSAPANRIMSTPCPNSTPPPSAQLRDVLSQPPSSSRNTSTRRHASQRPSSQILSPSARTSSQIPPSQAKPSHKPRASVSSTSTSKRAISFRKPQPFITIKTDKPPNQSTFVIHKTLIEHHSPFLRNAFNGDFAETKTQTMEMVDVSCDVFGLLVHWLYTTTIEFDPDEDASQLALLADLWKLAELCGIKSLQNEVMAMLHHQVGFANLDGMRELSVGVYACNLPMNKNLMKRMLVEKIALGSTDKELAAWMQAGGIPQVMVIDVMMALKKGSKGDQEAAYSVERYFV